MPLPNPLENVGSRPGMYLRHVLFDAAVAFVQGFDAATNGGLLVGFKEWLVLQAKRGHNLSWPELVSMLDKRVRIGTSPEATEEARVAFLFSTLREFVAERERPAGVRSIFVRYDEWLRTQDWYGPDSPDWQPRSKD